MLQSITPEYISHHAEAIRAAPLCVADANLSPQALRSLASLSSSTPSFPPSSSSPHLPSLWLEPVSVAKASAACAALHSSNLLQAVGFVSPNEEEAVAMAAALRGAERGQVEEVTEQRVVEAARALVQVRGGSGEGEERELGEAGEGREGEG